MSDNHAFGLRAQVAHRQAEFTGGPTMSDVMADLDLFRGEPTNAVAAPDAHYVALAEQLDVPLITCDAKLAGSNGHKVDIEVYPIS